jgi:thiol-disulfide isomerase/thioredoxin
MHASRVFVLGLMLVATALLSSAQQPMASPSPSLNSLPENILNVEIPSARGRPFKLSDYSGKVLIINVWATWLGPSRLEIPTLVKLQSDLWSKNVRVVGLTTELPSQSGKQVRQFVRSFGIQYKIGWAPQEMVTALLQGRDAIPQTFVVAPTGRILRRFIGFNSQVTPNEVRRAVDEALKDPQDH